MTLILEDITFAQNGITVFKDLRLTLEQGNLYTLLGPSTSGRKSLLRLIAGLDRPDHGKIFFHGKDITKLSVRERNVAKVYEEFINYPHLNVFDNIASPLQLRGNLSQREIQQKVHEVASLLKLSPFLKRFPSELSGGQQQRTCLARAFVKEADFLLLDNPLANLDYKLREELRTELKEILGLKKSLVIYSTPDPLEALSLGGQTIVIHHGQILQQGDSSSVYEFPQWQEVARLVSDPPMSFLRGHIKGSQLILPPHLKFSTPAHFSPLEEGPYLFGLRPQHILSAADSTDSGDSSYEASVMMAEVNGSETLLHLQWQEKEQIIWDRPGVYPVELGTRLKVSFSPLKLFAFSLEGRLLFSPSPPLGGA